MKCTGQLQRIVRHEAFPTRLGLGLGSESSKAPSKGLVCPRESLKTASRVRVRVRVRVSLAFSCHESHDGMASLEIR